MEHFDWLSRLLQIVPITGRVDHRCLFGAPWRLDNPAANVGEIPYHIILSGTAVLESSGGRVLRKLHPGDILVLPHGADHVLHDGSRLPASPIRVTQREGFVLDENDGEGEQLDMLCGSFLLSPTHEKLIRNYFPEEFVIEVSGGRPLPRESAMRRNLSNLVELMRAETVDPNLGGEAMLNALSTALFTLVLRLAATSETAPTGLLALAANPRLAPALSALLKEPRRAWPLPELARRSHMSRATFVRQFQNALGQSAARLQTDIRMTLAANELRLTDASTSAVADAAGYQSDAAFQRAFKASLGITPAQYRRLARLGSEGIDPDAREPARAAPILV